jgi:LmbE family N-acetylglucosaminyl deacetylase
MPPKRLLAILAHPDDESFGPGGTLSRYASAGVEVHIAIATDGAAGSVAEGHEESHANLVEVRSKELDAAVAILGATLHRLGYRDSGMTADPANEHPEAFINADTEEAIGRVVRLIRQIRPHVIITHDETGGYYHPDHIMCWKVVTPAFHAAGDPNQYPEAGEPYQPQRLYYTAMPKRWIQFFSLIMRLRGQDPSQAGRNKDIDLTKLGMPNERIHARIDIRPTWEVKQRASAEHASQGGGGLTRYLPRSLSKWLLGRELFMRAHPPAPNGWREHDLFG